MRAAVCIKIPLGAAGALFLFAALANLFSQGPQPSPTPGVSPAPISSGTPQPRPTPSPFPGAQNFHKWGSITVFNGLPSDSVRAIAQTADGIMWFGTDNGLARFDGRRVQNFSFGNPDTNRVFALQTSRTGELWVGTQAGAFVYSENRFQPVAGTASTSVTAILLDDENYVATDNGLVLRVTPNESGAMQAESLLSEPILNTDGNPIKVTSLIRDRSKLLAATSGRGIFVIENARAFEVRTAQANAVVNSMLVRGGEVWLGIDAKKGESGVYDARQDAKPVRMSAPTSVVLALASDGLSIWAGSERYGLFQFVAGKPTKTYTFESTAGGLRSDMTFALFFDREGVLWIGTNRGVSRYDPEAPTQQTVADIPNSNFIRGLAYYGEGHTIYAGSNRGLFEFNGERWNRVDALGDHAIYAISWMSDDPEAPVAGTPDGLFDVNGKRLLEGDVRSINEFNGREYAAVYGRGIFDVTDKVSPKLIFPNETVTALGGYVGKMWIGTAGNGLFSYDGTSITLEFPPDALKSGTIWNIWQAGFETSVWIAGQHGVFVVRNGNVGQIIAAEEVRDVWVADPDRDDQVWAATTTKGLIHARQDARFGWITTSVGFEQGLPSEKVFSILPGKEMFLVATNRGIVDLGMRTPVPPKIIPVRISSQRIHDLSEIAAAIELDYPQNSLLVEVAGLSSRTFPEEFQYAFVLTDSKGREIDRRLSNDSQYSPTNMKAGEYTIEAVAFNRDLVASEPLFIRFSVAKTPFPWTATALGVLLLLAVVGLVWAVVEHRRMRQKNRDLAAARLDLANEAERERRRIARDLHDQTLADLRNLMMMSDKLTPENPEFRSEIENVSGEIRRICEDLSPSVLENVGLVASLQFLLEHTIDSSRFSAPDDLEEKIDLPLNVELQIYRIAQEVLNNIQSHSDATEVEMKTDVDDAGKFHLSIADNGHAFSPEGATPKGRGIANIKARASLINARVQWRERKKGGNRFSLSL